MLRQRRGDHRVMRFSSFLVGKPRFLRRFVFSSLSFFFKIILIFFPAFPSLRRRRRRRGGDFRHQKRQRESGFFFFLSLNVRVCVYRARSKVTDCVCAAAFGKKKALSRAQIKFYFANNNPPRFRFRFRFIDFFPARRAAKGAPILRHFLLSSPFSSPGLFFSLSGKDFGRSQNARRLKKKKKKRRTRDI